MTTATTLQGTYAADPVHSSFGFAVRYQGVSIFRGTLSEVEAKLADGRLEGVAKVESISIRTPDQFRQHVLSAEFFDAANHPEVAFSSADLDLREDGTARVAGGQRRGDVVERAAEERDALVADGEAEARVDGISGVRAGECGRGGGHSE